MAGNTIVVVEDDNEIQEMIREKLTQDGYKVITTSNAKELLESLKTNKADTILLDLGLPDGDGLSLINEIHKFTDAPIIIVSGKGGMVDRVVGLEMGADDYISKPFQMRELSARIKANLRRYKMTKTPEPTQPASNQSVCKIKFGPWILDRSTFQVYDENNRDADLTTKEFQLLEAIVMAPNRVLSREQLFEMVRGNDYESYDRAIDVQITRMRKKIQDSAKSPQIIKTVRGIGYMLVCETEIIE